MNNRKELMEEYSGGYDKFMKALEKYPETMWHHKPSPDAWSIHEIIIHMADSEANSYVRCRKIIAENSAEIAPYDQDNWANELKYAEQDHSDALDLFRLIRMMNYKLLKDTQEMVWATHVVTHYERGNITLDDWLRIYVDHVDEHIAQMERVFEGWEGRNKLLP